MASGCLVTCRRSAGSGPNLVTGAGSFPVPGTPVGMDSPADPLSYPDPEPFSDPGPLADPGSFAGPGPYAGSDSHTWPGSAAAQNALADADPLAGAGFGTNASPPARTGSGAYPTLGATAGTGPFDVFDPVEAPGFGAVLPDTAGPTGPAGPGACRARVRQTSGLPDPVDSAGNIGVSSQAGHDPGTAPVPATTCRGAWTSPVSVRPARDTGGPPADLPRVAGIWRLQSHRPAPPPDSANVGGGTSQAAVAVGVSAEARPRGFPAVATRPRR